MRYVPPQLFVIAETELISSNVEEMLTALGANEFVLEADGSQGLIELAGRLCYKSFEVGLNPNVTKIREGNEAYLGNILNSKHGSVLEHGYVSIAMIDVSRIFTHELVRHRAGTGFSQESGRFVRLDEFVMYRPMSLEQDVPKTEAWDVISLLEDSTRRHEQVMQEVMRRIPWDSMTFAEKKRVTSALRRYAPQGQVTNIIISANHRAWRHMLTMRSSEGAEEEIKAVFRILAPTLKDRYPNIYQDMVYDLKDGSVKFENEKV